MAVAIVLLAVGVAALVYALTGLFTVQKGWQEIQASSDAEENCASDFMLLYDLGSAGVGVSTEKRGLTAAYTDAAVTAYRLFESRSAFEGVHNLWYLNRHPNETVDVDPALYRALEQVQQAGDRSLYLGPVYEIYNGLFTCESEAQTADYDPMQNQPLREYFARCAAFGSDPASVDVELLGQGQVRLNVSEEYLAFAQEQEIERYIDFYWMKNAFIADYLAQALMEKGYTRGALSSADGFVRNLGGGGASFALNIFDRDTQAGVMSYVGPMSIVYLRSYPVDGPGGQYYRQMADGQVRTAHLDPRDGLCRDGADDLIGYTSDGGCAETLLALAPVYVGEALDQQALSALAEEQGVFTVTCGDGKILYNDPELTISAADGYQAALRS